MESVISRKSFCYRGILVGLLPASLVLVCVCQSHGADPVLVIKNARVIVGNGQVKPDMTIVIQGDRIKSIGKQAGPRIARTIDAAGRTVMPGLIDMHVHLMVRVASKGEAPTLDYLADRLPAKLEKFLTSGVTTIKSTADPIDLVVPVRQQLAAGKLKGPRLLVVGPAFTSTGGHPAVSICKSNPWCRKQMCAEVDNSETAVQAVRTLAEKKVDAIKIVYDGGGSKRTKLPLDVMKAIIIEGHRLGLRVTVHTRTQQDATDAINAGADGLEHGVFGGKVTGNGLGDLMKKRGAFYVPTLTVWNRSGPQRVANPMANLQILHRQGVKIALGTDTFGSIEPGVSTVRELELMVQAGLPRAAAIQAATQNAAEHLGLAKDLGTLESGKIADLLIVDGDPLKDIAAMHNVKVVVQSGRVVHMID